MVLCGLNFALNKDITQVIGIDLLFAFPFVRYLMNKDASDIIIVKNLVILIIGSCFFERIQA